jgi:drug/metabolite transporter (DMT)-like permease
MDKCILYKAKWREVLSSGRRAPVSRPRVMALYGLLVVVWSSTWLAIKLGLEDCPPLLGAGLRFAVAGMLLLMIRARSGHGLRVDVRLAATLALFQFALTYGLVYSGERYIPSGLTAVLFGALPLYTALLGALVLPDAPLSPRLLGGILVAIAGLVLAFAESAGRGDPALALVGAAAVAAAPVGIAVGNVALKLRAGASDPIVLNGWAMLGGGATLLVASATHERWSALGWTPAAVGSIAYLAVVGSAVGFVVMTVLLRHISALATSCVHLLVPFGALTFGALLHGEAVGARALAGAALVSTGLLIVNVARRAASA